MARSVNDLDYELLSAYLDGALSDSERAALEARLQSETSLRRELEALRQTVTLVKQLPTLKAPRNFTLDMRIVRPSRLLIFPTTAAFSALSAIAAVLVFVVAGVLFMTPGLAPRQAALPSEPQAVARSMTETSTTTGGDDVANAVTTHVANTALSTQAPSPLDVPDEFAAGLADEQETTSSTFALPTGTALPPPSAAISAPALGGEGEAGQDSGGSQAAQQTDSLQEAAPTILPGFFAYEQTPPTTEDLSLEPDAESRQTLEGTAIALNGDYTVAQAEATLELGENEQSSTPAPTMTATLATTITPDGRMVAQQQSSDPNLLPNVLLAVGVILLILAVATTLARRRR